MYTSQIYYQRYEDKKATELMVRDEAHHRRSILTRFINSLRTCAIFLVRSCMSPYSAFLSHLSCPIACRGTVCNVAVGVLASKVAPVWFFVIGSVTTATANVLYASMDEHATYFTYQFFAQMLCVIGPDVVVVMGYIMITHVVDLAEVAVAGASLQFFVALGFVCGPSLSTIIYTDLVKQKNGRSLTQSESKKNPDLLSSLRVSFWFWAALGFTCESRRCVSDTPPTSSSYRSVGVVRYLLLEYGKV